jgi:phosphoserine phosphatase RsbU/P
MSSSPVPFRERSELLDFLLEISTATSQTLDLDRLLASIAESIRRVLPFELFAILLFNEKRQDLRIRYAAGHREEVVKNLSLPLGQGITGAAAAHRESILAGDVLSDPRYLKTVDAVRTELAVPMIARNKLVGVIDVQSTRLNAYSDYDRSLLGLIASRVAVTIENASLYRRVERQNRMFRTLGNISQEFSSILELDELLGQIARLVRRLISYDAFSILLLDPEQKVLRHRFSSRYDQRVEIDNIPLGKGITGTAAETRQAIRVRDTGDDPRYIASHPDIRSEVAVPLIVQHRLVGVMDLESERIGFFTDDHMRMLSLLAPQVASSVENARLYEELAARERRMEEDLHAARDLQSVLLPRQAPEIKGLEIAIRLRPAREISGDIYDFFEHLEHGATHMVTAFGDVSGKGAAAALYGALVSGLLRMLGPRRRDPSLLLNGLNDALVRRKVDARYVTLLILVWHPHSGEFTMANAGAFPPMICRQGEILKLRVEGVPLGLLDAPEYEPARFQAQPGDLLVLYSDGITDHLNPGGEDYGRRRLAQVVRGVCNRPAEAVAEAILADLDRFGAGAPAFDDQTLVVVKVK